ncbi:hypothetical protein ASD12_01100 [Mesorhizobium sp. Root102]|uniref:hypothetical protein n=1 Tax=Mesorhizobium sp. Root102 TaxID=1736422 RepID=UPI0006FD82BE|nr:hypothetical protein [Mesorhizobium sp. Root102]KQV01160.1 hypothetical protein ASD12_01100 [Mesorhizobium sp. Root102]
MQLRDRLSRPGKPDWINPISKRRRDGVAVGWLWPGQGWNALDFGSRVVVGANGAASVLVGGCKLDVPVSSSLDISRVGNNICLKLVGSEQTAAIQPSGGGGGFGPPEAIFDGALLTTGVLAATQDDDNGVSC